MNDKHTELQDTEIRIVSRGKNKSIITSRKKLGWCIIAVSFIAAIVGTVLAVNDDKSVIEPSNVNEETAVDGNIDNSTSSDVTVTGYTQATDTVVDGVNLTILIPVNCTPSLVAGVELTDAFNGATLVCQAPDLRADNGGIVGMCVVDGEILSRGESKGGFCAIINGDMTVGVARSTPELEQAIETGGDFFRQFPLVVGNQVIENKPKGKALRRALALLDGKHVVIVSHDRLTFGDFSEALCSLGVETAIYLTGATSLGYYITETGDKVLLGNMNFPRIDNWVFLEWR